MKQFVLLGAAMCALCLAFNHSLADEVDADEEVMVDFNANLVKPDVGGLVLYLSSHKKVSYLGTYDNSEKNRIDSKSEEPNLWGSQNCVVEFLYSSATQVFISCDGSNAVYSLDIETLSQSISIITKVMSRANLQALPCLNHSDRHHVIVDKGVVLTHPILCQFTK